jgi:ubiquinone/menaquinone biosynthesis C-methylase UbiE
MITFGRNNQQSRLKWIGTQLAQIPCGQTVLDAGAGEQKNKIFCSHLNYVSQDFCEYKGQGNNSGLQTGLWDTSKIDIISDITAIPVPDEVYDVIILTEVLEHLPRPIEALKELFRVLKRGGRIIITAPFCSLTHFAPYHYSTGFSKYWYEYHLPEIGFNQVAISANSGWIDYVAQEIWRIPFIGRRYSIGFLGWLALLAALPVLGLLRLMKIFDRGSDELLTFGFHVMAKKPIKTSND